MSSREFHNIDWIKGSHYPLQTYAWSGGQIGSSKDIKDAKKPVDAAPMIVTSQPPGIFADTDSSWVSTFGASKDAVLCLFNGEKFKADSIDGMKLDDGSVYRNAMGTADLHLYEILDIDTGEGEDGDPSIAKIQQIDYIVGHKTADAARSGNVTNIDTVDQARGISMRIPLMACGWGRTVGMHPTDPEPTDDVWKRLNDDSHKIARETWKQGPVDLRWDERRGVWGAWNDLIVDDNGQNLGTLVFSTNPDLNGGFPFLKGKLEDVWRVRRTPNQTGQSKDQGALDEFIKTADILTTLNHQWFDPVRNTAAVMSSIFRIDTIDGPSETLGTEQTSLGRLEILTPTYFHANPNFDGPIAFTASAPLDNDLKGTMKFEGDAWITTVEFDACAQVGTELQILYENDQALETLLRSTRTKLDAINIPILFGIISTATTNSDSLKQGVQRAIEETTDKTIDSIHRGLADLVSDTNDVIDKLVESINACLAIITECTVSADKIPLPQLDTVGAGAVVGGVDVEVKSDPVFAAVIGTPGIDIAEGDLIDDPCGPAAATP